MDNYKHKEIWYVIAEARVLRIGIVLRVEAAPLAAAFDHGKRIDTYNFATRYPSWRKKMRISRISRVALYRQLVNILYSVVPRLRAYSTSRCTDLAKHRSPS